MNLQAATGVLVIAHGSRDPEWVHLIEMCVAKAATGLPTRIAYLELVPGKSIEDGLRDFEKIGVCHVIAVPLFITAGSTHIAEIQHMLGVRPKPSFETDASTINTCLDISWREPMENHPLILNLLAERIAELSTQPAEEVLFLTGHGSEVAGFDQRWATLLRDMCTHFKQQFQFKAVSYGTLHPDTIENRTRALARKHRLIVLPLFLSEGYFTKTVLPAKLAHTHCEYSGRTYLPHPLVSQWIRESVNEGMTRPI